MSLRLSRDEGVQSGLFLMSSRIILRKLEPQYCCNKSWTDVNLENDTVKLIFWGDSSASWVENDEKEMWVEG